MFAHNILAPIWEWLVGTFGTGVAEVLWIILFIAGIVLALNLGLWVLEGVARLIIKIVGVVGFLVLVYILIHMFRTITFFFAAATGGPIV